MRVVVDSSLVIKWFIPESDTPLANELLITWVRDDVERIMPAWAMLEVSNALLQTLYEDPISLDAVLLNLAEIPRFVRFADGSLELSKRALTLARRHNSRSIYDFQFLALAEALECELWTADFRFWRGTRDLHVCEVARKRGHQSNSDVGSRSRTSFCRTDFTQSG